MTLPHALYIMFNVYYVLQIESCHNGNHSTCKSFATSAYRGDLRAKGDLAPVGQPSNILKRSKGSTPGLLQGTYVGIRRRRMTPGWYSSLEQIPGQSPNPPGDTTGPSQCLLILWPIKGRRTRTIARSSTSCP